MKDFTAKEAAAWVAQELAKHTTPESRRQRIASQELMNTYETEKFPVATAAGALLITKLREAGI